MSHCVIGRYISQVHITKVVIFRVIRAEAVSLPDYQIETTSEAGFLRVTARGSFGVPAMKALFDRAAADARDHGANRVLVGIRGVVGRPETLERFELGVYWAARIRVRAVLLGQPGMIDPARFGETVAVNRGAKARTFTDEAVALAWLLGDERP
jgi:hypothetical protein